MIYSGRAFKRQRMVQNKTKGLQEREKTTIVEKGGRERETSDKRQEIRDER